VEKQTWIGLSEISADDAGRCPLLAQSGHSRFTIAAVQLEPQPHFVDRKSLL
jgi:hypothetical protein